jgi:hypothetical protein
MIRWMWDDSGCEGAEWIVVGMRNGLNTAWFDRS